MKPGLFADLTWRGLVHQTTDPAIETELDRAPMVAYYGFDPSGDSLHVGQILGLTMLIRLQRAGHRPIALAGGGTGMIGDPSGKSDERQLLDADTLDHNLAAIRAQLQSFLDFGEGGALLVDNRDWLGQTSLLDFLRDVGKHFTVNAMVAKDSVRTRFTERDQGISFTEFSYMLLQAYDFEHLFETHDCRLQVGGSDQWGNITAGVDLIRRRHRVTAFGLTHPLITKADGAKFGKSETGTIWLDRTKTSPYSLYQFLLRTPDDQVGTYLRSMTFRTHHEIADLDGQTRDHPEKRAGARALAEDITRLVHGDAELKKAEHASAVLFTEDIAGLDEATLLDVMAEVPSSAVPKSEVDHIDLTDLLVHAGIEPSKGKARRTIEQGGLYINNRRAADAEQKLQRTDLLHDRYVVLRKGKAGQHLLRITA